MFDFRYHALSLAEMFLLLAIVSVLGVTIAAPLGRDVPSSLRHDVVDARRRARDADEQLKRRDQLIDDVFPRLAAGRLDGVRVALVATGSLPDSVEGPVREAVEVAGGTVDSVTVLDPSEESDELAKTLSRRAGGAAGDRARPDALGRRIGALVLRGGRTARAVQRSLPDRFRGDYRGAEAVAFFRARPDEYEPEEAALAERRLGERERLEDAMLAAIAAGAPLVGVEEFTTDPSEIPWYRERKLASVDSVDLAAGRLALVYALDGAEGAFGLKDSADRPLPELRSGG